jgi:hypothetical protein
MLLPTHRPSVWLRAEILPEFLEVNLGKVHVVLIPVLMFIRRHDYTTPSAPAAE